MVAICLIGFFECLKPRFGKVIRTIAFDLASARLDCKAAMAFRVWERPVLTAVTEVTERYGN